MLIRCLLWAFLTTSWGQLQTHVTIKKPEETFACSSTGCMCRRTLTAVGADCSDLNLTSLPQDLPKNVTFLSFSRNMLNEGEQVKLEGIEELWIDNNGIESITSKMFSAPTQVRILSLANNKVSNIQSNAFENFIALEELDLSGNRLQKIPTAIESLSELRTLSVSHNLIDEIDRDALRGCKKLERVMFDGNPIRWADIDSFANLPHLDSLILRDASFLKNFPLLTNTTSIKHVEIDRSTIELVPGNLCATTRRLNSLVFRSSRLKALPYLEHCDQLVKLDFSYGLVDAVPDGVFRKQANLVALHLAFNRIKHISDNAFVGLRNLHILDLEGNMLTSIDENAFYNLPNLYDLNLGNNMLSVMPHKHLESLREIKIHNNKNLVNFPEHRHFPRLSNLVLSYAYHCCQFLNAAKNKSTTSNADSVSDIKETILFINAKNIDLDIWGMEGHNITESSLSDYQWDPLDSDLKSSAVFKNHIGNDYEDIEGKEVVLWSLNRDISCFPTPGPFLPCEDLFEWWSLRCGVWIVLLLALLGNGAVFIVICFSRTKMDVPRFLVCNLAVADFFMGIYLTFLAVVDATTLGEFRVHAIRWQFSIGCKFAGLFGVLSSELSVFTLAVITLERHYAITHAMHLNKRLSLRHASYVMSICWTFALILAVLPLFGVSNYSKFAVCLPFETDDDVSLAYVVFLMLINGFAFVVLMACYLKMYCSIRGSQAWNSNDSRIAKRMALLVFTDFICWAPVAFFALSTLAGLRVLNAEGAKILTIFVLPFNSCANPFLYAIFTKQFKKDCVLICKRLEESKVSRGIGRHKHSSNFSNRPTPNSNNHSNSLVHAKQVRSLPPPSACACPSGTRRGATIDDAIDENCNSGTRNNRWKLNKVLSFFCEPETNSSATKRYQYAKAPMKSCSGNVSDDDHKFELQSKFETDNFQINGGVPLKILCRKASSTESHEVQHDIHCHRKASQDSDISSSMRYDSCSTSTYPMSRSSISSNDTLYPKYRRNSSNLSSPSVNNNLMPPSTSRVHHKLLLRRTTSSEDDPEVIEVPIAKHRLCRQSAVDANYSKDDEYCHCVENAEGEIGDYRKRFLPSVQETNSRNETSSAADNGES